MEKIKRFIECLVPVTACNLKCEYCYVIQEKRRKLELPKFKYDAKTIGQGLSKERLGGVSYISICGAGETLIPKEMPDIILEILKQGHFVNITTNGTITNRFDEILTKIPSDLLKRLHFAFSLHYIELKRTNNLSVFADNVKKIKKAGCSFLVQLNLYDGYIPLIPEIKAFCISNFNALPQVAVTRKEDVENKNIKDVKFYTDKTDEEYIKYAREFESPLFEYTLSNFMKTRDEFCYAGAWSFILNLATGKIKACYAEPEHQDIFEDVKKPIKFKAIGNNCRCKYCMNSSHFMSLGIIPEKYTKSYAEIRNRKEANWYNKEAEQFLNSKLFETNKQYSKMHRMYVNMFYHIGDNFRKGKVFIRKCINKCKKSI